MPQDEAGRPVRLVDDLALFDHYADSAGRWTQLIAAAELLRPESSAQAERAALIIDAWITEFLAFRGSDASRAELLAQPSRIAQALLEISQALEICSSGRQALGTETAAGAVVQAFYAAAVEIVLPGVPLDEWDEEHLGQMPHRGRLDAAARRIASLADRLQLESLRIPARLPNRAQNLFIARLGRLWWEWMEARPAAPSKAASDHRSPFATFVVATWGAIDAFPPSNSTIRRALHRGVISPGDPA